ncbi:hypothetical protein [Cytobacillus gottheilii]|uniref:hypothetical protein n=1 Tax=Cytobacillus gottheilii TaxID=859144 RepID=UPI0015949A18|nr:hypothetical protein [Cytobacillus gottheilii]
MKKKQREDFNKTENANVEFGIEFAGGMNASKMYDIPHMSKKEKEIKEKDCE